MGALSLFLKKLKSGKLFPSAFLFEDVKGIFYLGPLSLLSTSIFLNMLPL
jgi:hypothetical protein